MRDGLVLPIRDRQYPISIEETGAEIDSLLHEQRQEITPKTTSTTSNCDDGDVDSIKVIEHHVDEEATSPKIRENVSSERTGITDLAEPDHLGINLYSDYHVIDVGRRELPRRVPVEQSYSETSTYQSDADRIIFISGLGGQQSTNTVPVMTYQEQSDNHTDSFKHNFVSESDPYRSQTGTKVPHRENIPTQNTWEESHSEQEQQHLSLNSDANSSSGCVSLSAGLCSNNDIVIHTVPPNCSLEGINPNYPLQNWVDTNHDLIIDRHSDHDLSSTHLVYRSGTEHEVSFADDSDRFTMSQSEDSGISPPLRRQEEVEHVLPSVR
jgi:hypothetical protein